MIKKQRRDFQSSSVSLFRNTLKEKIGRILYYVTTSKDLLKRKVCSSLKVQGDNMIGKIVGIWLKNFSIV